MITWVFWKSHVSELCEKWTYYNNNYAYTRFEEFRTCSGEVLFTNEHKAVFSKNIAKTYTDINDLKIFKDFSKKDKTKFKKKPKSEIETITTETIKIITAKKDENIKGNYLAKIKEYTCMISDIYDLQQNTKEKLTDKFINLQNLSSELKYAKYQNNLLLKSEILEKIDVLLSYRLNILWNMVCKQNRKNGKITIDKKKDINRYLEEFEKMVNKKIVLLKRATEKIENLITTIKKKIDLFNKKLHKSNKINKAEIDSIKSMFRDFLSNIIGSLNEVIS